MLRFACKPDKVFFGILSEALALILDQLREEFVDDDMVPLTKSLSIMGRELLTAEVAKLSDAHHSPKVFMPTDYHFLILYEILEWFIEIYNDDPSAVGSRGSFAGVRVGQIDLGGVLDTYFWDTDFLFDADALNALSGTGKEMMGFRDATFGAVNKLAPHDDELALEEREPDSLDPAPEGMFKKGEDYPYWGAVEI